MSRGKEIEDRVQLLCERLFFADFTVRSPGFSKTRGREKEAADLLVPFGDRLLIFQIKTKHETKPASQKTETDFERIRRKVDDAIGQVKTAIRAVANRRFEKLITARGLEIPFDPDAEWQKLGLVVIDLLGEERFAAEDRTVIYNGYTTDPGIPTHVFLRSTFEAIASELDTLPDLLEFLSVRQALIERRILTAMADDLDLLAIHKMNPDLVAQAAAGACDTLIVSAGSWRGYQERHRAEIERRDQRNEPSFMVDDAISWLHKSIGHRIGEGVPDLEGLEQGTVEAYLAGAHAFASLTRLERRSTGEVLQSVMTRAATKDHAYAVWRRADADWGVLCFATRRSREERLRALSNLSAMAFCRLGLRRLLGIATEPPNERRRSFDFSIVDGDPFDPEERRQYVEEAERVFGHEERSHTSEYGE